MGPVVALVYQALWCMADDGGTAQCDADTVKAQMFYRWSAVGVPEISEALHALAGVGRIIRYTAGDDTYCTIPTWSDHQQVHKPSKFRNPHISQGVALAVPGQCGTGEAPLPASPPPRHLDTKTPRHLDTHTPQTAAADDEFDAAWKSYPKRAGGNNRAKAFKAWRARLRAGVAVSVLSEGLARYTAFVKAVGREGTEYVLMASTFFGPDAHYLEPWIIPAIVVTPSRRIGPTVTEVADREHKAQVAVEERYQSAARKAGLTWAAAHPDDFAAIKARVERTYRGLSGTIADLAIKSELAINCAKAADFPSFDAWLVSSPTPTTERVA